MSRCQKVRYPNKIDAELALGRIDKVAKKHRKSGVKQPERVYRCQLCKGWHLTSEPKSWNA